MFDELHKELLEKQKSWDDFETADGKQEYTESDAARWTTYVTSMRSRIDNVRRAGEISEYKTGELIGMLDQLSEKIKGGPRPR